MKIQPIQTVKHNFKKYDIEQDWHDDYATYCVNPTLNDVFITAGTVYAGCFIWGVICSKEEEIKTILNKSKNFIKRVITKFL